jgi:hypothetical protein
MDAAFLVCALPSNTHQAIDFGSTNRTSSAPSMSRSASTASDAHHAQSSPSAWQSMPQEPANDYTFYSDVSMRQQQALQPIPEAAAYSHASMTEWSPHDYVSNCIEPTSSSSLPSSLPMHSQQMHAQLTPTLQWCSSSDGSTAPSTPSTALMTPVTQTSNTMSRQSSCNTHFLDETSMLRIQSDSSCTLPILSEDGVSFFPFDVESKSVTHCVDPSLFPTHFAGSANEAFFSPVHSVSASASQALASAENMPYLAEDMRRSASITSSEGNASDASAPSSISSRQSRREREINALAAARKIAPKAIESIDETESAPSNQMARIQSEDGSSKTVGVISKTPYVRPQHPKIMCPLCQERPEGFRGTHELDRHIARAHATRRKGYICVDFSPDKKFLASCKHCRNKKVYGAYYNAAAHLRRAHFHPRKRGRKGKNDEKRGGIGGGDHPAMDYLKQHWIKEVEIDNNTASSPGSASDDAAEAIDNSYESTFDVDASASYPAQQPMPSPMNSQVQLDPSQYIGSYDLSMNASGNMMYDANAFNANNFAAFDPNNVSTVNDPSSFQFDAYM